MAIENKKNHFIWIDYLRTICCVSIVLIHVIGNWYKCVDLKHLMYDRYFIDCVLLQPFIRFAVPIFIMISGYLLLNPNKKLDIEKIQKYIIKMSIILVIFGLTFCFIENFFNFGSSNIPKLITNSFINFIEGKSWEHMWYLYMLLGLYLITPILRLFVKHANHKTVNFTLLSLLIVSIIIPTINDIFSIKITSLYLEELKYIFIYLSGYYICHLDIKKSYIYWAGLIGAIGYFLVEFFVGGDSQTSIFILLEAWFVFIFFKDKNLKYNPIINCLSKYSFGIYLVHTFWINLFFKSLKYYPSILPIGIGEFIFTVITLSLSLLTSFILYKLPLFKKLFN